MSDSSCRPNQETIIQHNKKNNNLEKNLGMKTQPGFSISNCISKFKTVEEKIEARHEAVTEAAKVYKANLPIILKRLSAIKDPRNPEKIKHHLTVLMLYGILTFVYHMASRREANKKMTLPIIMENLNYSAQIN